MVPERHVGDRRRGDYLALLHESRNVAGGRFSIAGRALGPTEISGTSFFPAPSRKE